ncbi:hypothetical protein KMW28_26205 [Flammeovirga yaeyamensis]|uniref:Uncharacterized protein n=1 Tax=Flammeovirga yaeyamensis TaxID=367791 RepID=A0AAX1NDA2_9BACT|nr:hypothetical protein [Flammeovirga yaeyamensis]MBB3699204.1 hypothetical protein [Flammeovirga yaeyamensis]NMF35532.1 hypothetical protein [Flammeovirga yaeyamensis]QWG04391.1 hypothetical protein KMW28_26205 [Flammeovirga yaeyamensis]
MFKKLIIIYSILMALLTLFFEGQTVIDLIGHIKTNIHYFVYLCFFSTNALLALIYLIKSKKLELNIFFKIHIIVHSVFFVGSLVVGIITKKYYFLTDDLKFLFLFSNAGLFTILGNAYFIKHSTQLPEEQKYTSRFKSITLRFFEIAFISNIVWLVFFDMSFNIDFKSPNEFAIYLLGILFVYFVYVESVFQQSISMIYLNSYIKSDQRGILKVIKRNLFKMFVPYWLLKFLGIKMDDSPYKDISLKN